MHDYSCFPFSLLLSILLVQGCAVNQAPTSTAPSLSDNNAEILNSNSTESVTHPDYPQHNADLDDVSENEQSIIPQQDNADDELLDPKINSLGADVCLDDVVAQYADSFIASSLMTADLTHDNSVIAFNSAKDDVIFAQFNNSNLNVKNVAQKAQVSCIEPWNDGLRAGLIVRDAGDGSFSHEVRVYDSDLNDVPEQTWRVSVRGFQSDAGTRCGFIADREILVTGIRPRADRPPYHGLFNAQKRALHYFENTQEHTPVFVSLFKNDAGQNEILLREVVRNENDKPTWPFSVYRLNDENTSMSHLMSADFFVHLSSGWLSVSKNGCCNYEGKKLCLDTEQSLLEVNYLGEADGHWMFWAANDKAWIVHIDQNAELSALPIESNRRVLYLDDQFWAIFDLDPLTPDLGRNLKIIRFDRECFNTNLN